MDSDVFLYGLRMSFSTATAAFLPYANYGILAFPTRNLEMDLLRRILGDG